MKKRLRLKKRLQNIREFLLTTTHGKILTFVAILLLIAILPVTIAAVQNHTAFLQHAAGNCLALCADNESSCVTDCQNKYIIDKQEIACENSCTNAYNTCTNSCNGNPITCSAPTTKCTSGVTYTYTVCSDGSQPISSSKTCQYGCNTAGNGCQPAPPPTPPSTGASCQNAGGYCRSSLDGCPSDQPPIIGSANDCPIPSYCCTKPVSSPAPTNSTCTNCSGSGSGNNTANASGTGTGSTGSGTNTTSGGSGNSNNGNSESGANPRASNNPLPSPAQTLQILVAQVLTQLFHL